MDVSNSSLYTSDQKVAILESLQLVEDLSAQLGTKSYMWGGMTIDIYNGKLLRSHDDLDYLTVNLRTLSASLSCVFEQKGCTVKKLINGDLSIEGTGINIHLGHIELDEHVHWSHNPSSEKGVLCFPKVWLRDSPYHFYKRSVHAVEPQLEYVLKCQPWLLNPKWRKLRKKDIVARDWLKRHLREENIRHNELYKQVSVCSPEGNG